MKTGLSTIQCIKYLQLFQGYLRKQKQEVQNREMFPANIFKILLNRKPIEAIHGNKICKVISWAIRTVSSNCMQPRHEYQFEPVHEKTNNLDSDQVRYWIQTGLYSHRRWLEA